MHDVGHHAVAGSVAGWVHCFIWRRAEHGAHWQPVGAAMAVLMLAKGLGGLFWGSLTLGGGAAVGVTQLWGLTAKPRGGSGQVETGSKAYGCHSRPRKVHNAGRFELRVLYGGWTSEPAH